MSLHEWIPPRPYATLARNGFALVGDLHTSGYDEIIRAMEAFQAEFLALTRLLWHASFPIPGDSLAHFSRQWEYPYAWANIQRLGRGRRSAARQRGGAGVGVGGWAGPPGASRSRSWRRVR